MKDPKHEPPNHKNREVDDRISAYLDGEMGEAQVREFEGLLDSDPALKQRLDALLEMNDWLGRTRSPAPDGFAGRVERAINAREASVEEEDRTFSRLRQGIRRFRWAWAPALVGAAAALFFLIRDDTGRISNQPGEPAGIASAESSGRFHEFRIEAADAKEVCLVGNFNQWKICETPLERADETVWVVRVPLTEGRHEYMFVVDGQWRTDPAAPFHVDDGFGNQNAVVYL